MNERRTFAHSGAWRIRQMTVDSRVGSSPFPPIAQYGFLSDCETCALVAPSGNVRAVEILRARYIEERQHEKRFTDQAGKMQYPQFRDKLLTIAAEESNAGSATRSQ